MSSCAALSRFKRFLFSMFYLMTTGLSKVQTSIIVVILNQVFRNRNIKKLFNQSQMGLQLALILYFYVCRYSK